MRPCNVLAISLFLISCLASHVEATPLFSMQAAEKCDTCHEMPDSSNPKWVEENYKLYERECRLSCGVCHVNPSGGMLRNTAGFYYGTKTLPLITTIPGDLKDDVELIKTNKFLTLGGDFRFMSLYQEDRERNPAFFPMQADLYVKANLHKNVSFLTQLGMERGGNAAVRESFGLLENLPYNSYLKLGKFIPPYGHRLEDHTAFIRTETGFDHSKPDAYYSGMEIGAEPLIAFGRFAYFNEDRTPAENTEESRRGVSGVLGWQGLWLQLGASYLDIINYESTSTLSADRTAYGIFGALRAKNIPFLERLTYLFEWDIRRGKRIDPDGIKIDDDAGITFNELNYRAMKGLNIKLRYEVYDPDEEDTLNVGKKRYVAGVDISPFPFTEFNLQYRYNDRKDRLNENEFLGMAHLWF